MRGRRDPLLLLAVGTSLALAATVALLPTAPWRVPLALLGGLWAPGYALVALAYPPGHLVRLERHGLAACAGLCLLPILALLSSETIGLSSGRVAFVTFAATALLALLAALRGVARNETLARSALPSTKVTLALCGGALLLAAVVEAASTLTAKEEPPSLALTSADGPLDLTLVIGEGAVVYVTARAGDAAAAGRLVVAWDGQPLHAETIARSPHAWKEVAVSLPMSEEGEHALVATWLDLRLDATFLVEAP